MYQVAYESSYILWVLLTFSLLRALAQNKTAYDVCIQSKPVLEMNYFEK